MKLLKTRILPATIAAIVSIGSLSAEIYIYQEKDGTTWFTDHKALNSDFQYIRTYGRPTATQSCKGVDREVMAKRAKPHLEWIRYYSKLYELDPILVHSVIEVESCFDAYAVSRVGARGLMQLMPRTAESLGVSEPFNSKENIRGGISYLRKMLNKFNNNQELALAAYNAGPTAVSKYNGIPPYRETQSYVKRIVKKYTRYKENPNFIAMISG
jgi:soluble lytic murein transglycosylase-like protein